MPAAVWGYVYFECVYNILNDHFEFVSNNIAIEIVHVQAERTKRRQNATRNNVSSFYGF